MSCLMWRMPSWEEEVGEFMRVSQALDMPLPALRHLWEESHVRDLDQKTWARLRNADSRGMATGDHEKAFAAARENGRDMTRVMDALLAGGVLPMPIVLLLDDGTPYLVAGNTRLMACRVEGRTPAVLLLDARPRLSSFRRGRA